MLYSVNSDNRVFDILTDMKRHLKYCRNCQSAMNVRDYDLMCPWTKGRILAAAEQSDKVIPRRLAAHRKDQRVFYACPDMAAHPKSWTITAEPLVAVGIQDSLF